MRDNWIHIKGELIKTSPVYYNCYLINQYFIKSIPSPPFNDFTTVSLKHSRAPTS